LFPVAFAREFSHQIIVNRFAIIAIIVSLLIGFTIGFVFANSVNRKETESLRSELSRKQTLAADEVNAGESETEQQAQITSDEIKRAVERADANPRDIFLQRNLGQSLYLYSAETKTANLLPDAVRLLERAHRAEPANFDTLVLLGNSHFELARATDAHAFGEARTAYEKALRLRPRDVQLISDLGLTHYYGVPSRPRRAIAEYEKALAINQRHEATLLNMAQALIKVGDIEKARQTLQDVQNINPNNPALSDLQAQLALLSEEKPQ